MLAEIFQLDPKGRKVLMFEGAHLLTDAPHPERSGDSLIAPRLRVIKGGMSSPEDHVLAAIEIMPKAFFMPGYAIFESMCRMAHGTGQVIDLMLRGNLALVSGNYAAAAEAYSQIPDAQMKTYMDCGERCRSAISV